MKTYFPKLDSLRFFAFIVVFISHTYFFLFDYTKSGSDFIKIYGSKLFGHGEAGVHIFFTLSGFLIMLLALKEFRKTGGFSIGGFFKRRILRIWPLYFLVLSLGFLVSHIPDSGQNCFNRFWYFLGNTCVAHTPIENVSATTIIPLWSISVEEQFYLIFPLLFAYFVWTVKSGFPMRRFIAFILSFSVIVFSCILRYIHAENWSYISYSTVAVLPSLVIGMILAYFMHTYPAKINTYVSVNKKVLISVSGILFILSLYVKLQGRLGVSVYILPLALASCIWISLATKEHMSMNKADEPLSGKSLVPYLGRISYGLYVYHMFVLLGVNHIFNLYIDRSNELFFVILKSGLTLGLTMIVAHLSYRYIEKWFLSFK